MNVDVPYEVIVVDSSYDEDVLAVVKEFDWAEIIRSAEDLSPGPARNLGVVQARGDFLAFIDADCKPDVRWLQTAYDALIGGAQMIGGAVLDAMPEKLISVVDNFLQFADLLPGRPREKVEVLPACNLAVRKEVFEAVRGFPDSLLIQDSLFTSNVAQIWPDECWFVPEMMVAHRGRSTFNGLYQHHKSFGYFRGLYRFRVSKFQQRASRIWVFIPMIVFKRLIYIYHRILKWNRGQFMRYLGLMPIVMYGLWGWAVGFHQGCRDTLKDSQLK